MRGSKEADLVSAVIMYAIRCLAEGDLAALRNMKFGAREIEALREMCITDLHRIDSLRSHCLEIMLNRRVYWPMIHYLREKRKSEEGMLSLVALDAPREMLQTLFGVNSREYSRLRRALSIKPAVGRPPEPDEESSHRLWKAWKKRVDPEDPESLSPEDYLELHNEAGLTMRAIWTLTRRWAQYGMPDSASNGKPESMESPT